MLSTGRRLLLITFLATLANATDNRVQLASQYSWEQKRGFYLTLENTPAGTDPVGLDTVRLAAGVGDGQAWRFVTCRPGWQPGQRHIITFAIRDQDFTLAIDGVDQGTSPGALLPLATRLQLGEIPGWAAHPATYRAEVVKAIITAGGVTVLENDAVGSEQPLALSLFQADQGRNVDFTAPTARPMIVTVEVAIDNQPDPKQLAPLIDRYGQAIAADWPGKVRSDQQLLDEQQDEAKRLVDWGVPNDFDRFGGWLKAGWRSEATGFYRVELKQDVWWLITPEGNPCFYLGICGAPGLDWPRTPVTGREYLYEWLPERGGEFGAAWSKNAWGGEDQVDYLAFQTINLIRRAPGADWREAAVERCRQRVKAFGFHGLGKWGGLDGLTRTPVLHLAGVPKLARHPDPFDPAILAQMRQVIAEQVEPNVDNPEILGWSLGNEYDEIVTLDEIRDILERPESSPARLALTGQAIRQLANGSIADLAKRWQVDGATPSAIAAGPLTKLSGDDLEWCRQRYADTYYRAIYQAVKAADQNHLYLGNWIVPGWWQNESDWELIAKHCDVVGYDRYSPVFADERFERLIKAADKPIFCGEFSFPATYRGRRGFGVYAAASAPDDAASGELYAAYVNAAATNPYCVGTLWFTWRDQALTGRGPGYGERVVYGEHYAFGVVDTCDRPKWELVSRMREANLTVAARRQAMMNGR